MPVSALASGGGKELTLGTLEEILETHSGRRGALLPILHAVQEALGHVPAELVAPIAQALNLSRAEVHGVISFYHDFRREPAGKPVIRLCRAEACQARGAERIAALIGSDPRVQVETVYCLGLCATGPSAMIDGTVHARIDETSARRLVERAAAG